MRRPRFLRQRGFLHASPCHRSRVFQDAEPDDLSSCLIFSLFALAAPRPTTSSGSQGPTPADYVSLGCFKDVSSDRIMETKALVDYSMTTQVRGIPCRVWASHQPTDPRPASSSFIQVALDVLRGFALLRVMMFVYRMGDTSVLNKTRYIGSLPYV